MADRRLGSLQRATGRAALAAAIFLAAVVSQEALYATVLQPKATNATGYATSQALGLLHGRGLTVRQAESRELIALPADADALTLYDPAAPRDPAQEPLPGTPLLFAAVAFVLGALRMSTIVHLQILLHGACSVWLFLELRHRSLLAAALAGLGWAICVPQFRSTLTPGYDSLTSVVYIAAAVGLLRHLRTGSLGGLLVASVACGLGLWVRSYLFVLPVLLAGILVWPARAGWARVALFVLPCLLLGGALSFVRAPESGASSRLTRGGVWHSFWAGVGQFENDRGVSDLDESVQAFAGRLAPDQDFRVPNYQYLPAYDATLRAEGLRFVRDEWPRLVRNALERSVWLVFPSFAPSRTFSQGAMRAAVIALGVPVSLAAFAGLWLWWRRDPAGALVLAAPLVSLAPLAPFYFIAKVPTSTYFVQLAFAGFAVAALSERLLRRETPPSAPAGTSSSS
ncbi:MAG: hypothetical protein OEP95_09710 [Myxococcales bacterium]|nr:hypothetical protein [Myxococcales bacterium]